MRGRFLPFWVLSVLCSTMLGAGHLAWAAQEPSSVVFNFTPVARAQIALWIESADGRFLGTVRLTQSVSRYGIGNRPGASQMNSGFRWPYGRREGVLPVWAHRRASAAGAQLFRRVIFQNRESEGDASRTSNDPSPDLYFCLSFNQDSTKQDALDAVSCASRFSSDKGRYLKQEEAGVYSEPVQNAGNGGMRALSYESYYPPRRDISRCTTSDCNDSPDVALYRSDAETVMPDIDTVTMATLAGAEKQEIAFPIPSEWKDTELVAWLEINVEGDHNATFSEDAYPTPKAPADKWDVWAMNYGYPYRGQPSVVFRVPFSLASANPTAVATLPVGYGSLTGYGDDGGALTPMSGVITDDAVNNPGSGADRLLKREDGSRLTVEVRQCRDSLPGAVTDLAVKPVADAKHSHEWGALSFVPPKDAPAANAKYEVRVSPQPIVDERSFDAAMRANEASLDSVALMVPSSPGPDGRISVTFGGLIPLTSYYVAVRAMNGCGNGGPISSGRITTTKINFTQLPPVRPWKGQCFVATAAYGSAMAPAVDAIRKVRDGARDRSGLFAAVDDLYHQAVPPAADALARSETARALFRELLSPVARASTLAHPAAGGTEKAHRQQH